MSNKIDRAKTVIGPGHIEFDGAIIYVRDGIELDVDKATWDLMQDAGPMERRIEDININVQFTPSGEITAGILDALYPSHFRTPVIGKEIFGGTDKPIIVWGANGRKYTISAGAVTQPPQLILSPRQTAMGQATLRGLPANDTVRSAANSTLTIETASFSGTAYNRANVKTVPYLASWGNTAPFDALRSESAFTIDFNVELEDLVDDNYGVYGLIISNVDAAAQFTPIGLTEAEFLAETRIQGPGVELGTSLYDTGKDFVVTGGPGNPIVTLKRAELADGLPWRWGRTARRFGQVTLVSNWADATQPLFEVGIVPPPGD